MPFGLGFAITGSLRERIVSREPAGRRTASSETAALNWALSATTANPHTTATATASTSAPTHGSSILPAAAMPRVSRSFGPRRS